jgi:hypothetical protein
VSFADSVHGGSTFPSSKSTQSGCVVPAHEAVTAPPSDWPSCPALASEASLVDVVSPRPEALASLDGAALPLEPAVPAAAPPDPLTPALELLPALPSPLDAPLDDPLVAPLADPLAEPLIPTWSGALPIPLQAANERNVEIPT